MRSKTPKRRFSAYIYKKGREVFSEMKKNLDLMQAAIIVLMVFLSAEAGITAALDKNIFLIELPFVIAALVFSVIRLVTIRKDSRRFLEYVGGRLGAAKGNSLLNFPMAVAVIDESGCIIWCNGLFHDKIVKKDEVIGLSAKTVFEGFDLQKALTPEGSGVKYKGGCYTVCGFVSDARAPENLCVLYFVDRTEENRITTLYNETRPVAMSIVLDNLDDLFANCRDSEKSRIMGEVENLFENFAEKNCALVKRYENAKYIVVVEQQYLEKMEEDRFSILDKARKILTSEGLPVTLSIGVAGGDYTLNRLMEFSGQALEMALGRGGDQAAVKEPGGYEFYGGFAKGVEKRTKVKTRVVAAALCDLIESSGNVLTMGHRFGDLDCVGAAIAMAEACRDMEKDSHVVVNKSTCLAKPLIEKTEQAGESELFLSPEAAMERVTDDTLLIIVDTHVQNILESKELYAKCRNVVVIDHHRRMMGSVENAVIFYHEPYASSASEMVTELLQYFDSRCKVTKAEAEALLSGIMLDTKSFTMRAGVRTFEAAAFLKKQGADTIRVKELFSGSLESYRHRSEIVSRAEIYRSCAISFSKAYDDVGLVAPQAADELLTIEGVAASVVMFKTPAGVSFSARSLGGMNVQVIMEALGGGGHQTMAGAQMPDVTPQEAAVALKNAIDKYFDDAEGHADQ